MLWYRGIAVHPGSIDFSALTRPAPPPTLISRASGTETTRRIWTITGLTILALLVVGGIFCGIVLCLMYKTKQKRKKRDADLEGGAKHRYRPVDDMEMESGGVQELHGSSYGGREVELPPEEVPRVQQLDGFVAPPRRSAQPVELAADKDPFR